MADNASIKVAHVMLLRGSADAIDAFLRHAPQALALTFNKHPRMRAKQVRHEFAMAEVHPATISAAQVSRDRLFEHQEQQEVHEESGWQKFVERECEVPFDRYASFPFYIRAWRYLRDGAVRVMLFSDHYMSDGISGLVVLNDVLEFASSLSSDELSPNSQPGLKEKATIQRQIVPLPLCPSLHDMWLRSRGMLSWLASKVVVQLFGKLMYKRRLKNFMPVIPVRADLSDFQIPVKPNSSSVLYAQGTQANLRAALTSCKREQVTFFGALAAAVSAAYFVVKHEEDVDRTLSRHSLTPFTLAAGVDYNMRRRVREPVPETQVGAYMCVKEIEQLSKHGVVMHSTRFWDLARQVKRDTDAQVESFTMPSQLLMLDEYVHAQTPPEFFHDLPIPNSVVSDVGISSLGKYPHKIAHSFRTEQDRLECLSVASIHFHSSTPHLGPAVGVYVVSVDAQCYTMKHKCGAADGHRLFAALVASAELIGHIGATETMLDVAIRVRAQL